MTEHAPPRTPVAAGPAHWGVWATLGFGVAIAAALLVAQVTGLFVAVFLTHPGLPREDLHAILERAPDNGTWLAASLLVSSVVCTVLVVIAVKLKRGSDLREYLGIVPVTMRALLPWIGVLAVVLVAWELASLAVGRDVVHPFTRNALSSADPKWLLVLGTVVAAPVFEEAFFRGFLFRGLAASAMGPAGAVLVIAALWALVHTQYDAAEMTFVGILGVLLGVARLATQSVVPPLVLHAVNNACSMIETAFFS